MEITLRGAPFPRLLAACGGLPNEVRTMPDAPCRLIVVLGSAGSAWACHGRSQLPLVPDQRWHPIVQPLARQLLGLPQDCPLLLFGTMGGGTDPRKGIDLQTLQLVVFG